MLCSQYSAVLLSVSTVSELVSVRLIVPVSDSVTDSPQARERLTDSLSPRFSDTLPPSAAPALTQLAMPAMPIDAGPRSGEAASARPAASTPPRAAGWRERPRLADSESVRAS